MPRDGLVIQVADPVAEGLVHAQPRLAVRRPPRLCRLIVEGKVPLANAQPGLEAVPVEDFGDPGARRKPLGVERRGVLKVDGHAQHARPAAFEAQRLELELQAFGVTRRSDNPAPRQVVGEDVVRQG